MRFVVLGDLHHSSYDDPELNAARDRVFAALFKQVASLGVDLVFAIGDTTNEGTIEEFECQDALAANYGLKLIRVTGNHDLASLEKAEVAPFFLGERKSVADDELYTAFDSGPARFVLLDTSRVKCSSTDWSGLMSESQVAWLEGEVERFNAGTEREYFVVLGHHALYNTTHRSDGEMMFITNGDEVARCFARLRRGRGLFINGHNHSNSLFRPEDKRWLYVQAGAPLLCESFRLITLENNRLQIDTVDFDLSDPELRSDFEVIRTNMGNFPVYSFAEMYGAEEDRFLQQM